MTRFSISEQRLEQTEFDQLPLTGPLPMKQSHRQAEGPVEAADRIGDGITSEQGARSGNPVMYVRPKTIRRRARIPDGFVRTRTAETRNVQHNQGRCVRQHVGVVEPPALKRL
jgi:hypothetical protein